MEIINENQNGQSPMTVGDWVLTIFISSLPLIGFVFLFIWAFGDNQRVERVTWAKATLVWMLIGIALVTIFFMIFGMAMFAGMGLSGMD